MERRDLLSLSVSTLCRGVDVVELDRLLSAVSSRVESHPKGAVVLLAGSRYDALRVILEGSVSAEMHHPNGKSVTIETIDAPDPIAPAILFAPRRALPVTVVAATDVRLLTLPLEAVLDLCQKNRFFLVNFLSEIGGKISLFAEKFRLLEFSSLRKRIAAYLAPRIEDGSFTLPFPKEKLSEFLSVARPSLSRELSAMVSDGLIAVDGRCIRVTDSERFRAVIEGKED
ncbi:MAG: Crp/Fnr family transcriptional regulator [Treponemataceae bacterium]